jgi:hypothetical protein
LDRASVLTTGDVSDSGEPDLWRVSTVHRVEELKSIVRMLPLWAASITLVTFLLVLNLFYYVVCFHFYTLKTFEVDAGRINGGGEEQVGERQAEAVEPCHVQVGSL